MKFMNEMEIDEALALVKQRQLVEFIPYVQYLSDWRDVVNANSDGWPYWAGGVKAAAKLIEQVENLVQYVRNAPADRFNFTPKQPRPWQEACKRALSPIKACATRHKWKAPELQPVQLRIQA